MQFRQTAKKDRIQRVTTQAPEVSAEGRHNSGNLGCGTLIIIFLLVAIAGKFIPHDGRDPSLQHSMSKGKEVENGFGKFARSLGHPSEATRRSSRGGKDAQGWLEVAWNSVGVFFSDATARLGQMFPRDELTSRKVHEWQAGLGLDRLLKPVAIEPKPEEEKYLKPTAPAKQGAVPGVASADATPPAATKNVVFNNPWDDSVDQVARYLKRHTHDADSMEFLEWGKVKASERGYQVRCRFRSRNVLGRYAVQNKLFLLDRQGNITEIKD